MGKFGFREKWADPKAISFADFQRLGQMWHDRFHISCLSALKSGNYMRIKNALYILSRIAKVGPTLSFQLCRGTAFKLSAFQKCEDK